MTSDNKRNRTSPEISELMVHNEELPGCSTNIRPESLKVGQSSSTGRRSSSAGRRSSTKDTTSNSNKCGPPTFQISSELEFLTVDDAHQLATLSNFENVDSIPAAGSIGSSGRPAVIYMQPMCCHSGLDSIGYDTLVPLTLYNGSADIQDIPLSEQALRLSEDEFRTPKEKKVARAVMVVACLLLSMCVVLVGVTLSMSDHIDNMVRKMHEQRMNQRFNSNGFVDYTRSNSSSPSSSSSPSEIT